MGMRMRRWRFSICRMVDKLSAVRNESRISTITTLAYCPIANGNADVSPLSLVSISPSLLYAFPIFLFNLPAYFSSRSLRVSSTLSAFNFSLMPIAVYTSNLVFSSSLPRFTCISVLSRCVSAVGNKWNEGMGVRMNCSTTAHRVMASIKRR